MPRNSNSSVFRALEEGSWKISTKTETGDGEWGWWEQQEEEHEEVGRE